MTYSSAVGDLTLRPEWQEDAACRDADPDLFFGPENEQPSVRNRRQRAAKKVCAGCVVRRQCLSHALHAPERYGVWGGTTASERAELRRRFGAGARGPLGPPSRSASRRRPDTRSRSGAD